MQDRANGFRSQPRICLVVCYFGKLPQYFKAWMHTVRYNPTIDFLVFSDCNFTEFDLPSNITVIKSTLDELKNRFSSRVGFEVSLDLPYKLCDFRIAYGDLFREWLVGYDWFGWCDIDLLFGDIRKFVTPEKLNNIWVYGKCGHLTIVRNDEIGRSIYLLLGSLYEWSRVFTRSENFAFDECTGLESIV